jgi:hypothetical protein
MRVAVELRREHLDPRARGADPDLATGARQRFQQARGVRRARRARYPEEDPRAGRYFGPFEAARKMPMLRMFSGLPRFPNFGIVLFPNLLGSET